MHPVLFHIGRILIPSYGALAARRRACWRSLLRLRTARIAGVESQPGVESLRRRAVCRAGRLARCCWSLSTGRDLRTHPAWMLGAGHDSSSAAGRRWRVFGAGVLPCSMRAGSGCRWPHCRRAGCAAGAGPGLRATGRAAGRLRLRHRNHRALGRHLHASAGRALERRAAGVPLHPVQAYAALGFLDAVALLLVMPCRAPAARRRGRSCAHGRFGVAIYITEFWRDPEGRGALLDGRWMGRSSQRSCWCLPACCCCSSAKQCSRLGRDADSQRRSRTAHG